MHYTYLLVRGCLVSGDVGVVKGLCVVCWGVVGERFEIILAVGKVELVPALASKPGNAPSNKNKSTSLAMR
jgi:hypothetical protein